MYLNYSPTGGVIPFFTNLTLNYLKIGCREDPYITELTPTLYFCPYFRIVTLTPPSGKEESFVLFLSHRSGPFQP